MAGRSDKKATRGHRFPKASRILKRADFLNLTRRQRYLNGRFFIIQFSPGKTPSCRLGITASRRIGSAVIRNRIKRIVRECFRRHHQQIFTSPVDLAVIAKKQAASACHKDLKNALLESFAIIANNPKTIHNNVGKNETKPASKASVDLSSKL